VSLRVAGVDPGSRTIGVGVLSGEHSFHAWDVSLIVPVMVKIREWHTEASLSGVRFAVAIEDYVGAGPRDRDSIACLHQVGYIRYSCDEAGIECRVQPPSARKRSLQWAYDVLEIKRPKEGDHDVDMVAALAHAKTLFENLKEGR
jgi:hypothetical protein